jgi:hypothetical protein
VLSYPIPPLIKIIVIAATHSSEPYGLILGSGMVRYNVSREQKTDHIKKQNCAKITGK